MFPEAINRRQLVCWLSLLSQSSRFMVFNYTSSFISLDISAIHWSGYNFNLILLICFMRFLFWFNSSFSRFCVKQKFIKIGCLSVRNGYTGWPQIYWKGGNYERSVTSFYLQFKGVALHAKGGVHFSLNQI